MYGVRMLHALHTFVLTRSSHLIHVFTYFQNELNSFTTVFDRWSTLDLLVCEIVRHVCLLYTTDVRRTCVWKFYNNNAYVCVNDIHIRFISNTVIFSTRRTHKIIDEYVQCTVVHCTHWMKYSMAQWHTHESVTNFTDILLYACVENVWR